MQSRQKAQKERERAREGAVAGGTPGPDRMDALVGPLLPVRRL